MRAVPDGVADEPRGGRRPRSRAWRAGRRVHQVHISRCRAAPIAMEEPHGSRSRRTGRRRCRCPVADVAAAALESGPETPRNVRSWSSRPRLAQGDLHRRSPSKFEGRTPWCTVKLNFGAAPTRSPRRSTAARRSTCSPQPVRRRSRLSPTPSTASASRSTSRATNSRSPAPGNPRHIASLADTTKARHQVGAVRGHRALRSGRREGLRRGEPQAEAGELRAGRQGSPEQSGAERGGCRARLRTDVKAAGSKVTGVEFPECGEGDRHVSDCRESTPASKADGEAFIAYVLSSAGQAVLSGRFPAAVTWPDHAA